MERLMPWRSLDDRVLEKQPLRSVFVWFLESLILRLDSEIGSGRDDRETCNRWQRAPTDRKMDQRRGHRGRQTTRKRNRHRTGATNQSAPWPISSCTTFSTNGSRMK